MAYKYFRDQGSDVNSDDLQLLGCMKLRCGGSFRFNDEDDDIYNYGEIKATNSSVDEFIIMCLKLMSIYSVDGDIEIDANSGDIDIKAYADLTLETTSGTIYFKRFNSTIATINSSGLKLGSTGATVDEFSMDESLTDNSDTLVPTQQAVKQFVLKHMGTAIFQGALPGGDFSGPALGGYGNLNLINIPSGEGGSGDYFHDSWHVPSNYPTGKTWKIKVTYLNNTAEYTASEMKYYLSAYKEGDVYSGWNLTSNDDFGDFTSDTVAKREQVTLTLTGKTINPGQIVTLRMYRDNSPANTISIVGIELYYE